MEAHSSGAAVQLKMVELVAFAGLAGGGGTGAAVTGAAVVVTVAIVFGFVRGHSTIVHHGRTLPTMVSYHGVVHHPHGVVHHPQAQLPVESGCHLSLLCPSPRPEQPPHATLRLRTCAGIDTWPYEYDT